MSNHRYWRILIWASGSGAAPDIAELTGASSLGGGNLFTGGTAASSSDFSGSFNSPKAFDANNGTSWSASTAASDAAPAWLSYDLGAGSPADIVEFAMRTRNDGSFTTTPTKGLLQYSDDNSAWFKQFEFWAWPGATSGLVQTFNAFTGVTRWDPFNATTSMLVDGSTQYKKVTSNAVGTIAANRVMPTAKTYFEAVATALGTINAIGFVTRAYNMSGGTILGTTNEGLGFKSGGTVVLNNATLATIFTYTTADRIGVAVDLALRKVWFTKDGTTWNNDVIGNQDPANNIGGIDYSTIANSSLFPAVSCSATGAIWNADFVTFTYTPPTGFISPDTNTVLARQSCGVGEASGVAVSISTEARGAGAGRCPAIGSAAAPVSHGYS